MRVTGVWFIENCEICEGIGFLPEDGNVPNGDKMCKKCNGYGLYPDKYEDVMVPFLNESELLCCFPQKKLTQQYIEKGFSR